MGESHRPGKRRRRQRSPFFPANPRAFYHVTNALRLDFLARCAERQGATGDPAISEWVNRHRIGDASVSPNFRHMFRRRE